jgi:transcriptional regulator with PAS, ATPase and Fis domain
MQELRANVHEAVQSGAKDILLLGEPGTGKEVVAKLIAQLADPSRRFIPIHCGAISDGIAESELFGHVKGAFTGADKDRASAFEAVGGGFVFFDEIGDMPLHQQAKLLRVIQERKVQRVGSIEERQVSFRSISATNVTLEDAIKEKRFREDLYYRLAKIKISIPALRERLEDIPELVHFFLSQRDTASQFTITDGALSLLKSFHWPGNVRQL